MTDGGERTSLRMAEKPLRQAGDKGVRSNRRPRSVAFVREIVQLRRPGAVTGEMEGDEPEQARRVADIVRTEVEIFRNRLRFPTECRASPGTARLPGGAAAVDRRWESPFRDWP